MKLDICLQADLFNVLRNLIWDEFQIDCSKYITSCSLSLDLMLKYTGGKIQLFKDITMFDFINSSIMGVCVLQVKILLMIIMKNQLYQVVIFAVCILMLCLKNCLFQIIDFFQISIKINMGKTNYIHVC